MIYKNTIKILFSNFDIVWKTIIYYFLSFFCISGLIYLFIAPYIQLLNQTGIINDALEIYTNFLTNLNLTQLFSSLGQLIDNCWIVITRNISQFWYTFISLGLILIFLRTIIYRLTILPACNSLHYYMGSMNKTGFYSSFRDCFGKSLKVQLVQFFVFLPINALFVLLFVLCLKLFNYSFVVSILAIILIIVLFVVLFALKNALFAGWIPTMIVLNFGIIKSLKVSFKNSLRIFTKIFGSSIGVILTIFLINIVIAPFTFMVGLLITIPASYFIHSVFGMVVVYESQGMRYYVDIYNVVSPQKREKRDKLKEMKFII